MKIKKIMSVAAENKEKRRRNVLLAAESLIRKAGEVSFNMEALAKEAGVSFATPFNHFGRKNGVLLALLAAKVDSQLQSLQLGAAQGDPLARILEVADQSTAIYCSDPELYRPIIRTVLPGRLADNYQPPDSVLELWRVAVFPAFEAGDLLPDVDMSTIVKSLHLAYTAALLYWATGLYDDGEFEVQARSMVYGAVMPYLQAESKVRLLILLE